MHNKKCWIWDDKSPHVVHEKQMHGLVFILGAGNVATVNGERYHYMLNNFIFYKIDDLALTNKTM